MENSLCARLARTLAGLRSGTFPALPALLAVSAAMAQAPARAISFGTVLVPDSARAAARRLAQSLAIPGSAGWQAKGDQRRTYRFAAAGADVPYRVCVPAAWDGHSRLPLVMFLHGAGNDESSYLDQNGKQMVKLADQHGYLLVSPLGYQGAYGTFLRLPAVFGQPSEADKLLAAVTDQSERDNEWSEQDVLNVLERVLAEYPIDSGAVFLTGHSMGSGGTWYIGGKYPDYWRALAPMSGPFVLENGYPWDAVRPKPVFITEGTQAATLDASRILRDWMAGRGYAVKYKEVAADHPGMVPLVLPDVFAFFDSCRTATVALAHPSVRSVPTSRAAVRDAAGRRLPPLPAGIGPRRGPSLRFQKP